MAKEHTETIHSAKCDIEDLSGQLQQAKAVFKDLSEIDPATVENFIGIVVHRSPEGENDRELRVYAMGTPQDIVETLEKLNTKLLKELVQQAHS